MFKNKVSPGVVPSQNAATLRNRQIDIEGLRREGFPENMIKAFLETADNLNCIVMSRMPEGPTTTLIDDLYDLKGFEIKSKSCNWGPMAGFLCKLPPLNKKGFDKIIYNYDYLASFYKKWSSKTGSEKRTYHQLFQPIQITEKRKIELFEDKDNIFGLGKDGIDYVKIGKDYIYGYCSNLIGKEEEKKKEEKKDEKKEEKKEKDKMELEYLLKKDSESGLWQMYHGVISYKQGEQELIYTGEEEAAFFSKKNSDIERLITQSNKQNMAQLPDEVSTAMSDFHEKIKPNQVTAFSFYAIEGAINVYPPYSEENEQYKNCVTGDYDLFACWPKSDYLWRDLVRKGEMNIINNNSISGEGSILTVSLNPHNAFNQLFIEFIPGTPAIDSMEDQNLGNLHDLTYLAGQTLNSLAGMYYQNNKILPNKAFHSDEGGRPMIIEIDFPVSCFLPHGLFLKTTEAQNHFRQGLFNSSGAFIDMIAFSNLYDYRITLSHGWLFFLITQALDDKIRKDIVSSITVDNHYLKQIYQDPQILIEKVEAIKNAVTAYFFNNKKTVYAGDDYKAKILTDLLGFYKTNKRWVRKDNRGNRMKATPAFLEKIAKIFLLFLDMDEPDEQVILNKVQVSKTIVFENADFELLNP